MRKALDTELLKFPVNLMFTEVLFNVDRSTVYCLYSPRGSAVVSVLMVVSFTLTTRLPDAIPGFFIGFYANPVFQSCCSLGGNVDCLRERRKPFASAHKCAEGGPCFDTYFWSGEAGTVSRKCPVCCGCLEATVEDQLGRHHFDWRCDCGRCDHSVVLWASHQTNHEQGCTNNH